MNEKAEKVSPDDVELAQQRTGLFAHLQLMFIYKSFIPAFLDN